MKIIAVDDDKIVLSDLKNQIDALESGVNLLLFTSPMEALQYIKMHDADAVFLDVHMQEMNGIELAKKIKEVQPRIKIIFITGYDRYAVDAFALHATGFLLKPVSKENLKRELDYVYEQLQWRGNMPIRVQTFGGFEVFVNGTSLKFSRSKTKELLACLVNRRGAGMSNAELAAMLWEDKPFNMTQKSYLQTLIADLKRTLKRVGAEELIIKRRNSLAVDVNKFECDYYEFLKGNPYAVNAYQNDYMPSYSWAEFTAGRLYHSEEEI